MCEAQGDELHLGAMYSNRACLWIMLNDPKRFDSDTKAVLELARRIGNIRLERDVQLNAGYFHYWRGEHAVAEPHVERVMSLDQKRLSQGYRPDGDVLLARVKWARGERGPASAIVRRVIEHQAGARENKQNELLLAPNDQMLLHVIALATSNGSAAEWDEALEEARQLAQGQELIEVLELRGIVAQEAGQTELARRAWDEALAVGENIPNVMAERIRARLAALKG